MRGKASSRKLTSKGGGEGSSRKLTSKYREKLALEN